MKKISNKIWQEYYSTEPNNLQKAFLQRWFELLDSNTNFINSIPQISLKGLLEELHRTEVKHLRTIFFQLLEINIRIKNISLLHNQFAVNIKVFIYATDKIYFFAKKLFNNRGERIDTRNWSNNKNIFISEFDNYKNVYNSIYIENVFTDDLYYTWLTNFLEESLTNKVTNLYQEVYIFSRVDFIIKEILVYLIEKDGISKSYLKNKAKAYFFSKNETDFHDRASALFKELVINFYPYFFYYKIQKKYNLIPLDKFRRITFVKDLKEEISNLEYILKNSVTDLQFSHLKYFLHYGDYPEDKTIVKIKIDSATEFTDGLKLADENIIKLLNVFKFEYSARNITISNKVLGVNTKIKNIAILNRKSLHKGKIHNVGTPLTLQKVADHIALDRFIAVKEIALFWYRQAIDSQSSEAQFLNFWVSLEHVFRLSTKSNPNSPGDKLVRTIGDKITQKQRIIEILNLWGDIYRVGIFNPRRIKSNFKGRLMYSDSIFKNNKNTNQIITRENTHILVKTPFEEKKVKVAENSIIFLKDGDLLEANQWISGKYLDTKKNNVNNLFRIVFQDVKPTLINILYLIYYSYFIENQIIPKKYCQIIENNKISLGAFLKAFEELSYDELEIKFPEEVSSIDNLISYLQKKME